MLKAYHEKPKPELVVHNNKLGLENPRHSESCVGQEAEKEEDTESEVHVRLGNDQQPIKLQNSQILNDLGTKLYHLPLVQRKELAEVITQYREAFPDVPRKTNLIEHDVDVGDSATIKQHPYRVSPMKKELLDKEVQYMLKNVIIEEIKVTGVPHASWSQNMTVDSDFVQTLEKSMIKQSLIHFPYPEWQTALIKLAMPSLSECLIC